MTGYEAVTQLLADPQMVANKSASTTGFRGQNLPDALEANLLNIDGADHRRVRQLAAQAFAPRHHLAHEEVVAAAVAELIESLPPTGEIDLMGGLCEPLPPRVIGELLGLPREQLAAFRQAARPMFDTDQSKCGEALRDSLTQMLLLVAGVIAEKRRTPGDDLLSQWLQARDGDDRLSEQELISLVFATVIGGFENVTSLTALVIDEVVREHEEHARDVLDDDAAFTALIRTTIGNVAPVNYALRRFPLTDIEVNGVTIPRGHTVFMSLRSAHLDPVSVGRPDLVFGWGRHHCIGAALAQMQVVHATRAVLRRWPHLRTNHPRREYQLRPSWLTYALAELTITAGQ
ncbi:hypothetical protein [Nocardia fluminea]|uniref:hypothetical protein n=1 Tax=Nocardia fluminea TaxID=134984 RepID=UPI003D144B00